MPKVKNKSQIIFIHGGMTFKNRQGYLRYLKTREITLEKRESWGRKYLDEKLGKDYDIIRPTMPLKENANYLDWKINFERYLPLIRSRAILIGSSLGGIFLAKYLSENKLTKKFLSIFLISPPYDGSLSNEDLAGGFRLKSDLSLLESSCKNLYLFFSESDEVVPVSHATKYALKLKKAQIAVYAHINGHFQIAEFPELVKFIRRDFKKL